MAAPSTALLVQPSSAATERVFSRLNLQSMHGWIHHEGLLRTNTNLSATRELGFSRGKIANYNDCNSQFFIGFATIVKILPWLYSILQQLCNAASCLHLHLFVNTFNTTV